MLSSVRFWGDDTEKGLADPHGSGLFLTTEEALGSAALEAEAAEKLLHRGNRGGSEPF